jgi:hypothetical protein
VRPTGLETAVSRNDRDDNKVALKLRSLSRLFLVLKILRDILLYTFFSSFFHHFFIIFSSFSHRFSPALMVDVLIRKLISEALSPSSNQNVRIECAYRMCPKALSHEDP